MGSVCTTAEDKELQRLLEKIYRERGFDFREYRESTLTRRLARRLQARGVQSYAGYARVLDQDPVEYDRLFNDLTINVTGFFRDEAFKALEEIVLPTLMERKGQPQRCFRIWSAGCATGEEPYSIAMLLLEFLGRDIARRDCSILATDIDTRTLQRAGEGVFGPKALEGIRPEWRDRYFITAGAGSRVRPFIRKLVTFQAHNLVSDPPYCDLDLVVCRNVLIYFTPPLQTRVLKGFHQGLKRGGFLFLGKAETPTAETKGLFRCVDRKARLYRKGE